MRAEMGKQPSRAPPSQLQLPPGFRFYPSDEELVIHYLCKKAASEPFSVPIIAEVELYKFDPWVLPDKALFGEKEWYFFSPRDRKYPNGSRPNRAAGSGYWKATGTDKPISTLNGSKKVGVKKALVFYKGKAPKGVKTNWIMHEYRLADSGAKSAKRKGSLRLDDWVLCRIYKKSSSAQKAAKDQRCEASCQEDVLSFLPEIDAAEIDIPRLNSSSTKGFVADHEQGVEKPNMDFYQQQVQMLQTHEMLPRTTDAAVAVAIAGNSYRGSEESSQGASSLELSHWSNELSRQNSPPDSVVEDDSVESTFNSIPSLISTNQFLGNLPHPIFNFDGLPSPFGRLETFPPLGDGDYFNFTPDYSYFPRSIS